MSKVVIIGSGLGGLSCGHILSRNGYEVTILEQGLQLGGCLQCFTRRGAKFETGMHFIGSAAKGQTMNRVLNYFGLGDLKLNQLDTSGYNTISLGGSQFRYANGREAFIEQMASYFPAERDALHRYTGIIDEIAAASSLDSLTSPDRDIAAATKYQMMSINEVLDSLFRDEMLKSVLAGDLPLYAGELDKTPFSQHAFIMDFYNQSAFRIVGGSDAITDTMVSGIENMGGRVLSGKKVVKVHCDDTRATGVETQDGSFYPADYVISTVHPKRLMEMLDTKLIRPAFRNRINSMPQTAAGFALYVKFKEGAMPYMNTNFFGYRGLSPWNCEHYTQDTWPTGFLYMHMCHEDRPLWARSGVVLAYMGMEEVARWQGLPIGRRGEEYEQFKKDRARRLIAEVDAQCSGFAQAIDSYWTSTPLTYLDYTGTEGGSMYGVAKDITLGPAGRVPYRTRIPNLLLAGQNINSHGILGVIVATLVTCSDLVSAHEIYKQIESSDRI